eukprot:6203572-Pleurochrysis_carterae.AAC.2
MEIPERRSRRQDICHGKRRSANAVTPRSLQRSHAFKLSRNERKSRALIQDMHRNALLIALSKVAGFCLYACQVRESSSSN